MNGMSQKTKKTAKIKHKKNRVCDDIELCCNLIATGLSCQPIRSRKYVAHHYLNRLVYKIYKKKLKHNNYNKYNIKMRAPSRGR